MNNCLKTMMSALFLSVIFWQATSIAISQGSECGNGLPQQLSVGVTGWVIPEPPQSVNVRNFAGGDRVGQIEPAENFTVLAGPECDSTYSWWQIESDTGVVGWIAEGVDDYFVEPLATGGGGLDIPLNDDLSVVIESRECEAEPVFAVGDAVRSIDPISSVYFGHPLIEDGLFSIEAMGNFYEQIAELNILDYEPRVLDNQWYIIDGPYCVDGSYIVKLGDIARVYFSSARQPYYGFRDARGLWYYDTELTLADEIPVGEPFEKTIYELKKITNAPLIDPSQQIAYGAFGGGSSAPNYWNVENCSIGEWLTNAWFENILNPGFDLVSYPTDVCVEVYPVPEGNYTVHLYQPDGTLYDEIEATARANTITRELGTNDATLSVQSVKVDLPNTIGLMTGIWQIEVTNSDFTTRRAYNLLNDTLQRIQTYCEGPHPITWMNGFGTNGNYDLVYVGLPEDYTDVIAPTSDDVPYEEIYRWQVVTDENGRLFFDTQFIPSRNGFFVVVAPGGNWAEGLEFVSNGNPGIFAAYADTICHQPEEDNALEPNRYATGLGEFTFTANQNDVISVETAAIRGISGRLQNIDLKLEVYAPDGSLIVENDNAENPKHAVTDPALESIILPDDGEYRLVLSAVAGEYGTGGLILHLESASLTEANVNLVPNTTVSANLEEQSRWIFEGVASDTITIAVDSDDFDPMVSLADGAGVMIADDDDSGDGLNANLSHTLSEASFYVVNVSSYSDKTGQYTLEITNE